MINRLTDPSDGAITYGGLDVSALRGARLRRWQRDCAMIFQQFNLVNRLTVLENVLIGGLGLLIYQIGIGEIFAKLGADNTFGDANFRVQVWHASLQAFHDFTLTGIGIGAFRDVVPVLYPNTAVNSEIATHAHNLYLQIGLDLGLPGLLAYLSLFATMLVIVG